MLRLKAGRDACLNDLMDRWQKPVLSFILRYVGNRSDALDLAQETFVRVYRSRGRYSPKGKFSTWLFTIARNLCLNHARWKSRHPSVPTITDDENGSEWNPALDLADPADTPDEAAEGDERARLVRDAVAQLPEKLKTPLLLFHYQDLPYQEIAKILGCSPKAVETRLYRARKEMADKLKKAEI